LPGPVTNSDSSISSLFVPLRVTLSATCTEISYPKGYRVTEVLVSRRRIYNGRLSGRGLLEGNREIAGPSYDFFVQNNLPRMEGYIDSQFTAASWKMSAAPRAGGAAVDAISFISRPR